MRSLIVIGVLPILCSCTTVSTDTKQYYSSRPGMSEDAQDFPNTKYNLMDSSVIGAGSVVTKNIENFTVAAGNPAKTIRKRGSKRHSNSQQLIK